MRENEATRVIDEETYTKIDEETYMTSAGGEWVIWERKDIVSKIRWAEREMKRWAPKIANYDEALCYTEALEIRASAEEDLRIVDLLWPR
jgi:hypothetical protein